jgi:hypothetical protein
MGQSARRLLLAVLDALLIGGVYTPLWTQALGMASPNSSGPEGENCNWLFCATNVRLRMSAIGQRYLTPNDRFGSKPEITAPQH